MIIYDDKDIGKLATWRASYWAKKQTYINFEDLLGLAYLSITKGLKKYNPERGVKMTTYLTFCIDNTIKTELAKESKQALIKETAISNYEDNEYIKKEQERVRQAITDLEDEEQELIILYFYKRATLKEIAAIKNTYEVDIYRKLEKIKLKLKDLLTE